MNLIVIGTSRDDNRTTSGHSHQLLKKIQSRNLSQLQVYQQDVRMTELRHLERLFLIGSFSDNLNIRIGREHEPKTCPHDAVVFDDPNANSLCLAHNGISILTTVRPDVCVTCVYPPRDSALSEIERGTNSRGGDSSPALLEMRTVTPPELLGSTLSWTAVAVVCL